MIIAFFSYIIYKSMDQTGEKEKEKKKEKRTNSVFSAQISVEGGELKELNLLSSSEEREERMKRRKLLYARNARRNSKNQVWAILRYMVTYRALLDSTNFYNYKKNWEDHKIAIVAMEKMHPDDYSFNVAFRFCQKEHYIGLCTHSLTNEDILFVRNWKDNNINIDELLLKVFDSYKSYWNDVLHSYVRQSARTKRLQYLVDDLDKIMTMPEIIERPIILDLTKKLQMDYQSQLELT